MFGLALRAALLDESAFEHARERQEAMFSALGIVLLAGVCFGLGIWSVQRDSATVGLDLNHTLSLLMAVSTMFMSWMVWAILSWLLGRVLFQGDAGYRDTVRAIGVCYLPLALLLLIGTPLIRFPIAATAIIAAPAAWTLVAGVVAVRTAHRLPTWKAVISGGVGWFWGVVVAPWFFVFLPLAQQ